MSIIEWILLALALGTFTITEQYKPFVTAGLLLLLAAFLLRWLRTRHLAPRTGMEAPIGLFLTSAGLACWIAYDPGPAKLQYARILGAAVLFWAVVDAPPMIRRLAALALVLAAALLALYWPLQHNFATDPGKFEFITAVGRWLNGRVTFKIAAITGDTIDGNVAGGTLALAVPFGIALALEAFHTSRWPAWARVFAAIGSALVTLLILAGLALTSSRGAWLGLGGAAGLFGLAWVQQRFYGSHKPRIIFWGTVFLACATLVAGLSATHTLDRLLGSIPDPTGTLVDRPRIWLDGLPLLRDYAFTGAGLMTFRLVYSIYGILIHTPYLSHLHNTFLEVGFEQGALGVLAMFWAVLVAGGWAWRAGARRTLAEGGLTSPFLGCAGLAALMIAGLHGIFDVVFYVERTLPLVGLAAGFAALLNYPGSHVPALSFPRKKLAFTVLLAAMVLILAGIYHRSLIAQAYANQGAILQTRLELSQYNPVLFDQRGLDDIRQQTDLRDAEDALRQALSWNPNNPTALQRLAEINLSTGQYSTALSLMQTAWEAGERDSITRLLLGDALVAAGQPASAASVVRGVAWAEARLMFQAWYRFWVHADYQRAAYAWGAVLELDPTNPIASDWQGQAQKKIK